MESIRDRDYVDQEHVLTSDDGSVTIYFLKESKTNALQKVKALLIDAYENRVCESL